MGHMAYLGKTCHQNLIWEGRADGGHAMLRTKCVVLLGKLRSCRSRGCHVDTSNLLYLNTVTDRVIMETVFTDGSVLFSRVLLPDTPPTHLEAAFRVLTRPPNSADLNSIEQKNKFGPRRPDLITYRP